MDETKEVATLTEEQINALAEQHKKDNPVSLIENTLAEFLKDTFNMAREEDDYQKQLKTAVLSRITEFKPSELVALLTSATTNKNDLISKVISPSMQLLAAKQQNEMAAKHAVHQPYLQQTNIRELNAATSSEILTGLKALTDLLHTVPVKPAEQIEDTTS